MPTKQGLKKIIELPAEDRKKVAWFCRLVQQYRKMKRIEKKHEKTCKINEN